MSSVLAALLLYNAVVPERPQLTVRKVNDSIAQALASATPPPALSADVYRAIWPSIVFIQTQGLDEEGEEAFGVGNGLAVV